MSKLLVTGIVSAALGAVLVLALAPSVAQEAKDAEPADTRIGAVVDVTPITKQIAALRKELAAVRAAVADAEGLRGDVTKATAALRDVQAQVKALNDGFAAYAEATQPILEALQPPARWQYRVLRTRSESVINRLGREGWAMVTASEDWLFFRKPLAKGKEGE